MEAVVRRGSLANNCLIVHVYRCHDHLDAANHRGSDCTPCCGSCAQMVLPRQAYTPELCRQRTRNGCVSAAFSWSTSQWPRLRMPCRCALYCCCVMTPIDTCVHLCPIVHQPSTLSCCRQRPRRRPSAGLGVTSVLAWEARRQFTREISTSAMGCAQIAFRSQCDRTARQ